MDRVAYWLFGLALGCALAVGIGKPLLAERGRGAIGMLCLAALCAGLVFGWAIDTYVGYVRSSAAARP